MEAGIPQLLCKRHQVVPSSLRMTALLCLANTLLWADTATRLVGALA